MSSTQSAVLCHRRKTRTLEKVACAFSLAPWVNRASTLAPGDKHSIFMSLSFSIKTSCCYRTDPLQALATAAAPDSAVWFHQSQSITDKTERVAGCHTGTLAVQWYIQVTAVCHECRQRTSITQQRAQLLRTGPSRSARYLSGDHAGRVWRLHRAVPTLQGQISAQDLYPRHKVDPYEVPYESHRQGRCLIFDPGRNKVERGSECDRLDA